MQAITSWLFQNGFELISALGIVASLLFTALSFREGTQSRRLNNLLKFTERHEQIWTEWESRLDLSRIMEQRPDLNAKPITDSESRFGVRLIIHLHSWYRAAKDGEVADLEGVKVDVAEFFELPIPGRVWLEKRKFYDEGFVYFVDAAAGEEMSSTREERANGLSA